MEQFADENERECYALRAKLAAAEARISELEEDARDIPTIAYMSGAADWKREAERWKERCEALEWLVEVQELRMHRIRNAGTWGHGVPKDKLKAAWKRRDASNGELRRTQQAALAAEGRRE